MRFNKILVFLLLFLSGSTYAQQLVYSTLAAKGTCVVQRGENPDEYVPITAGVELFINDEVIVTGTNTYMGLVGQDGQVIEIKSGGVYRIAELAESSSVNQVNLQNQYALDLLQLTKELAYEPSLNIETTRATGNSTIKLQVPNQSKVFEESFQINWQNESGTHTYMVAVCDMYDTHIFKQKTEASNLEIDLTLMKLSAGQMYKLVVADADAENNMSFVSLEVPSRSEIAKIETDLRMLRKEIPQNSAIGDLVLASYFEKNGLYINAMKYYQAAIKKQPEIVEYQKAYAMFLKRMQLS
jgi:hypothetical protein